MRRALQESVTATADTVLGSGASQGAFAGRTRAFPRDTANQGSGPVRIDPRAEGPGGSESQISSLALAVKRAVHVSRVDPHESADTGTSI